MFNHGAHLENSTLDPFKQLFRQMGKTWLGPSGEIPKGNQMQKPGLFGPG